MCGGSVESRGVAEKLTRENGRPPGPFNLILKARQVTTAARFKRSPEWKLSGTQRRKEGSWIPARSQRPSCEKIADVIPVSSKKKGRVMWCSAIGAAARRAGDKLRARPESIFDEL
jgi:hypothetical protein